VRVAFDSLITLVTANQTQDSRQDSHNNQSAVQ